MITLGNLSKTEGGELEFEYNDTRFKDCGQIGNLRLRCESDNGTKSEWSVNGMKVSRENLTGQRCVAAGFFDHSSLEKSLSHRIWSECFTQEGYGCEGGSI